MPLHHKTIESLEVHHVPHAVMDCDPALADTAEFCAAYGVAPEDSANTILVSSRRPVGFEAACVVLATTRLDVNRRVRARALLEVRKISFASAERTKELTDMEIGGVTPFGLPDDLRVLVDEAVMSRPEVIIGGGTRTAKLRIEPAALLTLPTVEVISGLAQAPDED